MSESNIQNTTVFPEQTEEILSQIQSINQKVDNLIGEAASQGQNLTHSNARKIEELGNEINQLKDNAGQLSSKFDIWQDNVESLLSSTQTAMTYDNYVLTCLAIAVAIAAFLFQKHATQSKVDAIKEAKKEIEDTLAEGLLPLGSGLRGKLVSTVVNSSKFQLS